MCIPDKVYSEAQPAHYIRHLFKYHIVDKWRYCNNNSTYELTLTLFLASSIASALVIEVIAPFKTHSLVNIINIDDI